jgi:hypothetical protein
MKYFFSVASIMPPKKTLPEIVRSKLAATVQPINQETGAKTDKENEVITVR